MPAHQSRLSRLFSLAIPIMLTNLLQVTYNLVDAWFLGKVSAEAVSAPSIIFSVVFFLSTFGIAFAQAGTTLIAQAYGRKNRSQVDFYAAQTVGLVSVTGIVVGIVGVMAADPLLFLLRVPSSTYEGTRVYMSIIFASVPFMFFFLVLQGVMQGVGDSLTPLWVQVATVNTQRGPRPTVHLRGWASTGDGRSGCGDRHRDQQGSHRRSDRNRFGA